MLAVRVICSLASALFFGVLSANAEERSVQTNVQVSRATYILEKIKEADIRCAQVPLSVTTEVDVPPKSKESLPVKRITERPVALCAYGEESKTWHVIHVHLPSPVPKEYITCVRNAPTLEARKECILPHRVVTPGYVLEHIRGYGIVRLTFNVYVEKVLTLRSGDEPRELRVRGEKLTVYRTRHLWFDDEALQSGDVDRIIATASAVNYTPYHIDFGDDELVVQGADFLFGKVRGAQRALGLDQNGVRSHALPRQALGVVVAWQTPMALAIIEQMDDKTFEADKKSATNAVLIEYALNRDVAFRFSQSGANAIGPLQFTDAGGNGTYSAMVREYPEARLEPRFQVGARNLGEVLKFAIALIDHEVSRFPESIPLFKKNPQIGGAIPVAAYNGGPASGRALFAWLKKNRINIERKQVNIPRSFLIRKTETCPCVNAKTQKIKKKGTVVHFVSNTETPGYLVKYLYLLNYLADLGLE